MSQLDFVTDVKLEQEQINREKENDLEWQLKAQQQTQQIIANNQPNKVADNNIEE